MRLRVYRALCGITEAGPHWSITYLSFHKDRLGMTASAHDLCLLFTENGPSLEKKEKLAAITCLQADDTVFFPILSLRNSKNESLPDLIVNRFQSLPLELPSNSMKL